MKNTGINYLLVLNEFLGTGIISATFLRVVTYVSAKSTLLSARNYLRVTYDLPIRLRPLSCDSPIRHLALSDISPDRLLSITNRV
ncbi:MAG TPA: hypothetical protein DDZ56_12330 [Cytophagales bacterium]|nr:hypothetical protein [Cytophagales bacterium]